MKIVKIKHSWIFAFLTAALLLTALSFLPSGLDLDVGTALANDDCTWTCLDGSWDQGILRCEGNPKNCSACELVCPDEPLNKKQ